MSASAVERARPQPLRRAVRTPADPFALLFSALSLGLLVARRHSLPIDVRTVPDLTDPWFWAALVTGVLAVVCALEPRRPRWYVASPAVAVLAAAVDPWLVALAFVPPVLLVARALGAEARPSWLAAAVLVTIGPALEPAAWSAVVGAWLVLCVAGVVMTVIRREDDPEDRGPSAVLSRSAGAHRGIGEQGVRVHLSRVQWQTVNLVLALTAVGCVAIDHTASYDLVAVLVLLWLVGRPPSWWPWVVAVVLVAGWLWLAWLGAGGLGWGGWPTLQAGRTTLLLPLLAGVGLVGAVLVTSGRRPVRVLVLVACLPLGPALLGFLVGVVLDRAARVVGPGPAGLLRFAVLLALAATTAATS